ncbi:hypothetical protein AC579_3102 [Pseudocercospora musae]|uniref:Uncharacterized protein n=1 Tax=Pseudocercospora musae TaxID=113226 RepID=A0A139IBV8_9PEZI|nr:hypothetical protein AC579_3102 [Pseudocercospora musae]
MPISTFSIQLEAIPSTLRPDRVSECCKEPTIEETRAMAGTRSSATKSGTKRKADDQSSPSSKSKRGRPAKDQKTLEETIKNGDEKEDVDEHFDDEMQDEMLQKEVAASEQASKPEAKTVDDSKTKGAEEGDKTETNGDNGALDRVKADANEEGKTSKSRDEETNGETAKRDAVVEDKKREEAQPSNVLEKGVIYFFTRGRVGVEDPDSVQDLQRSFFVLRPLPPGGKLTDGAVQDVGNNRLVALPKKVFPRNAKDRFMAFTEKAKVSMDTLKEEFFQGSSYSTQTTGTRHTPEVTPVGEGVYAITSTGGGQGTTHLAYMLTIPSAIGEVQKDLGLAEKGSFALSLKNPESSAPVNALPNAAEYSKEIIDEFRGRGWMPAVPKHLDYVNSSFLMIGEGDFEKSSNLDPAPKDEKDENKETPQEELEKLEGEDEHRVDNLKGDDTIFADLGVSSKDYPKVLTTW